MMSRTDDPVARVLAQLPCSLRGNAPPHRTADTGPAASAADRLSDDVVSAGEALHYGTAVGEVASPNWSRGRTADGEVISPSWPRAPGRLLMPRSPLLWLWMSLLLLPYV